MVYNLCTNKLVGDEGSDWWSSGRIYSGKTKLDKRVQANLDLVEKFVSMGVPRKQIFISDTLLRSPVAGLPEDNSMVCLLYTSPSPRD